MSALEISFTDAAARALKSALEEEGGDGHLVRIEARRLGLRRLRYGMDLVPESTRTEADRALDVDGVRVVVDGGIAGWLTGTVVDYIDGGATGPSGFKFKNPQEKPAWEDPVAQRIQTLLDEEVNPGIAAHHGFIELASYEDGVAYVHMGGGCTGCGLASRTLSEGVASRLKEAIPELREVRDATDHAAGENPFFLPE